MKFFIDFEATRFSNRIISIGCVADNGATFRTLVKPVNKAKVDNFITELTGITKEMLEEAPTADEAFNQLFDFIELNNDDKMPEYYCYGNTDVTFIKSTVKFMTDARACICAQAIEGHLIDYSLVVKRFFMSQQDFALRKVYMLIQGETDLVQNHDALEDAMMLRVVVSNLHSKCNPRDKETILSIPSKRHRKKKARKHLKFLLNGIIIADGMLLLAPMRLIGLSNIWIIIIGIKSSISMIQKLVLCG